MKRGVMKRFKANKCWWYYFSLLHGLVHLIHYTISIGDFYLEQIRQFETVFC